MIFDTLLVGLTVVTLIFVSSTGQIIDWCYEGACGPKTWTGLCATGKRQSPINIVPSTTTRAKPNRTLVFSSEWYEVRDFTISNNGKFIQIGPYFDSSGVTDATKLRVKGAGWNGTFEFVEMQFHWGSEHMVKGQRFALEAQILLERKGSLGMISILFGTKKDVASKALAPIVDLLSAVSEPAAQRKMPNGFNMSTLFPNVWDVFRYSGSLTIPPCNQSVLWSVFTQKMPISQEQVETFSSLQNFQSEVITQNYRPLQTAFTTERKKIYWMKINRTKMIANKF